MALGTPVVAATAYSASGGTSVAPAYPSGILATDSVLLFVGQKPSTANGGTVTTPTGWTLLDELTAAGGYGTTLGADTGNTNLRVYSWDTPVAGQTGTRSVTLGGNGVSWAFIVRIPTGGGAISYGSADGQRTTAPTAGTPFSVTLTDGATPTAFQTGDVAIWAMCIPTDVTTPSQFSAQDITATGAVFGTPIELNEPDSQTGNDIGGYSAWDNVDSGSSTAAPVVTVTAAGTVTNVRGPIVLVRIREAQAISFNAESGSFTVTGQATTLSQAHNLNAEAGSFSYTGQTAELTITAAAKELDAQPGAFTYSGQAATLSQGYAINAQAGSFAYTGQAATLLEAKSLNAQAGSFSLNGQAATLTEAKAINAQAGSFAVSGQDATLVWRDIHGLDANAGSFSLTGQAATLTRTRAFNAEAGSFAYTGQDATLIFTAGGLNAEAGAFSLTGQAATLLRTRTFNAEAGAYDEANPYVNTGYVNTGYVTGETATFVRTLSFTASSGSFFITGQPATMVRGQLYPDPADVRAGVVYGPGGIYTGTLVASKAIYLFDD